MKWKEANLILQRELHGLKEKVAPDLLQAIEKAATLVRRYVTSGYRLSKTEGEKEGE